jgi:hypothetical protein
VQTHRLPDVVIILLLVVVIVLFVLSAEHNESGEGERPTLNLRHPPTPLHSHPHLRSTLRSLQRQPALREEEEEEESERRQGVGAEEDLTLGARFRGADFFERFP